ncbi:MAG: hypothetical protein AAFX85_14090, partial [Pseudomonadota bacterium]
QRRRQYHGVSTSVVFLGLVVLMTALAMASLALPALRATPSQSRPVTLIVTLLVLPAVALFFYPRLTNFDWAATAPATATPGANTPEAMVAALAQRLTTNGGSVDEWRLLGRSFFNLTQFPQAEAALREAYRGTSGGDPLVAAEVAAEYAEAMILNDQRALAAEAGALLEQSLSVIPDNPRALWWGGLGAFERGEYTRAVGRWEQLLAAPQMADQERMRTLLEERLAMARNLAATGAPPPSQMRQGAPSPPTASAPDGAGAARTLKVSVTLADGLEAQLGATDPTLFIIARPAGGGGGPPLAVSRRQRSELPLEITLSDTDAMIPGRGISSVDDIEVVARLSASGNPIASSGDLFGITPVGDRDAIDVKIDQVTP